MVTVKARVAGMDVVVAGSGSLIGQLYSVFAAAGEETGGEERQCGTTFVAPRSLLSPVQVGSWTDAVKLTGNALIRPIVMPARR